jgi:hypothetical protein
MFDYDIRLNDVIQLMVKPDPEILSVPSTTAARTSDLVTPDKRSGGGIQKNDEKLSCFSKFYKVGDLIDVRKISSGAWFEGKIVNIMKRHEESGSETIKLRTLLEGACSGNFEDVNAFYATQRYITKLDLKFLWQ